MLRRTSVIARSMQRLSNENKNQAKLIEELREFVDGALFTMQKVKKHNNLTSHDDEMIRQKIDRAKQILGKLKGNEE